MSLLHSEASPDLQDRSLQLVEIHNDYGPQSLTKTEYIQYCSQIMYWPPALLTEAKAHMPLIGHHLDPASLRAVWVIIDYRARRLPLPSWGDYQYLPRPGLVPVSEQPQ